MPSEQNLQLLLAVPVLLAALCTAGIVPGSFTDQTETSGGGQQDTNLYKLHDIAKVLLWSITRLRDEQFLKDFGEPLKNMTNYEHMRTEMPLIRPDDRCQPPNFSAPICRKQIHAGLSMYKAYLGYLEKVNLTAAHLPDIKQWTSILSESIRTKVEDTHIQSYSISTLENDRAWNQKIFIHSILYNFTTFLKDASRALKYMITKRLI